MSVTINGTTGLAGVDGSASTPALQGTDSNTGITFGADTVNVVTGGTTRATVDSSGNVGIGTSSPNIGSANADNTILTLKGKTSTRGGIFEMSNFGTTGNDQTLGWNRYFDGSTENASIEVARASSTSTAYMKFSTNGGSGNTERARIDSSGNLYLGGTTTLASGPYKLNVETNLSTAYGVGVQNTGTSTGGYFVGFFNSSNTQQGGIVCTNSSTVSYNTSSDYRLKENIAPMTGALEKVAQLKPVIYKWKVDGSDGEGFIAHELAEVVPQCVTGEKDAVDAEGNPQYQGIDTSFLVATLTAAIKEQQAMIQTLTARIEALEAA